MIAFLGMGLLGSNFVRALRNRNVEVQVWNRTASKAKALEEVGAKAFESVADAVKGAERIHIVVSDDAAVDAVLAEAAASFSPNVIIVDHTTTSASGAARRSKDFAAKGIRYIHAPVFMGPSNALEASGTMLISGDQDLVKELTPELSQMTGSLMNLGSDPAKAAAFKLLGNHFLITLTGGIADTFALAKSLGVENEEVSNLFQVFNPGTSIPARVKRMLMADYDNPTWELSMARKDARLMIEEAHQSNINLGVISAIAAGMDTLIADGHGGADWTIIAKDAITK